MNETPPFKIIFWMSMTTNYTKSKGRDVNYMPLSVWALALGDICHGDKTIIFEFLTREIFSISLRFRKIKAKYIRKIGTVVQGTVLYIRPTLHCSISNDFVALFPPWTHIIFKIGWFLSMHICVCILR